MPAIRVALTAICAFTFSITAAWANPSLPLFLKNPDGAAIRALVIGIDAYQHVRPLKGSVADARDIEAALRSMGTSDIVTLIAYQIDPAELITVIDRIAAISELKRISTKSPKPVRIAPDDAQHHNDEPVQIEMTDVAGRSVILFDISGDGTIQMLYPIGSDASPTQTGNLRLPLRVRGPFGAEQVVVISTTQRLVELEQALLQLNRRKSPGQMIKAVARYLPADTRVGSIGFFTAP